MIFAMLGGLLGAVIGSFIATLVLRWPAGRGLGGRSQCDGCAKRLGPLELIPIVSFMLQRGKCRVCGVSISRTHLVVEILCSGIGAIACALLPGWTAISGAAFGWILLALAVLDFQDFWLPDRLTGLLAVGGLVTGGIGFAPALTDRLIGGVSGYTSLAFIAWAYKRFRGREGLGGGDPKLLGAIGLWTGCLVLPQVLIGASLSGLVAVFAMRLAGRRIDGQTRLPLGTLLAGAAFPVWIFGQL